MQKIIAKYERYDQSPGRGCACKRKAAGKHPAWGGKHFARALLDADASVVEKILHRIEEAKEALARRKDPEAKKVFEEIKAAEGMFLEAVAESGFVYRDGKIVGANDEEEERQKGVQYSIKHPQFTQEDIKQNMEAIAAVERIVICAPIQIGTEDYYMGVMLQRDTQSQRLYLHSVASLAMKEEATSSSQADRVANGALEDDNHLFMTSILQKAVDVKRFFEKGSVKKIPQSKSPNVWESCRQDPRDRTSEGYAAADGSQVCPCQGLCLHQQKGTAFAVPLLVEIAVQALPGV